MTLRASSKSLVFPRLMRNVRLALSSRDRSPKRLKVPFAIHAEVNRWDSQTTVELRATWYLILKKRRLQSFLNL